MAKLLKPNLPPEEYCKKCDSYHIPWITNCNCKKPKIRNLDTRGVEWLASLDSEKLDELHKLIKEERATD